MSSTTDFVTELWKAANQVGKQTVFKRRWPTERAR